MYAHNKVIFGCDRANSKYKVPSCRFFGSQPLKSHIRMVNARSREMSILRMFRIIEHIETLCKSKQKIKFKKKFKVKIQIQIFKKKIQNFISML